MTNEELLKEYNALPEEARKKTEEFISQMSKQYADDPEPKIKKLRPIREEPFFGMWADREDMKEGGAAWVRKIRKEQWDRSDRWSQSIQTY